MLNLEESLKSTKSYLIQRDFYSKGFLSVSCVIVFLEILRSQIAQINLLQLIPGFYLVLLFSSFLFFIFFSDLFFRFPFELDKKKK
jgi:hypothetical protein